MSSGQYQLAGKQLAGRNKIQTKTIAIPQLKYYITKENIYKFIVQNNKCPYLNY